MKTEHVFLNAFNSLTCTHIWNRSHIKDGQTHSLSFYTILQLFHTQWSQTQTNSMSVWEYAQDRRDSIFETNIYLKLLLDDDSNSSVVGMVIYGAAKLNGFFTGLESYSHGENIPTRAGGGYITMHGIHTTRRTLIDSVHHKNAIDFSSNDLLQEQSKFLLHPRDEENKPIVFFSKFPRHYYNTRDVEDTLAQIRTEIFEFKYTDIAGNFCNLGTVSQNAKMYKRNLFLATT
jgi:hypothetical protein